MLFQSLMSAAAAAVPQLASAHTLVPKVEEDAEETSKEESPEVDIVINNVVCSFSVRCHLNLKEIALNGSNVEYRRENGMVTMKLRLNKLFLESDFLKAAGLGWRDCVIMIS